MGWVRRNKFGARPSGVCSFGYSHRSKLERSVCDIILARQHAGEIEHLQHEFTITLDYGVKYIADFKCRYLKNGEEFFVEAKGLETPVWRIKLRMYRGGCGPAPLEIYKGSHFKPMLYETVIPKEINGCPKCQTK